MTYGTQIGRKFSRDGTALRYPGNTVIADIRPGCGAFSVLEKCLGVLCRAGLDRSMIQLPRDSFHTTVIRLLNDQVRTESYWPPALRKDAPMSEADGFVSDAIASVAPLGPLRMRFQQALANAEDFRVLLVPANEAQSVSLRNYRDAVADRLGFRLPGHDAYGYHITLAYARLLPKGSQAAALAKAIGEMNALLAKQDGFVTDPPYLAFYENMLSFSAVRPPRCTAREG